MVTTPHTAITLLDAAQAQKEVSVNDALLRIDALLNQGAINSLLNTPPANPNDGDVYIVADAPTDAWSGFAYHIAYFHQRWHFIAPGIGATCWDITQQVMIVFDGSLWVRAMHSLLASVSHETYVSAYHLTPTVNNGCSALFVSAQGGAKPDIASLAFDASSVEYAQMEYVLPAQWSGGNVTVQLLWSHSAAQMSSNVVWSLETSIIAYNTSINADYDPAILATATGGLADALYSTAALSATVANGMQGEHALFMRISRVANDGADTLPQDARLHGAILHYSTQG